MELDRKDLLNLVLGIDVYSRSWTNLPNPQIVNDKKLIECTGGFSDKVEWNKREVNKLTDEELEQLYKEMKF